VAGERSGEDLAHGLGGGAADETGGHAEAAVMSIPVTTLASVPSAIRTPPITSICQSCIGRSRSNRRNSSRRFLLRRRRPERPIASRAVAGLVLTALGVAAEKLQLYYQNDDGAWIRIPATVDTTAQTVTAAVDHFTVFALGTGEAFETAGGRREMFSKEPRDRNARGRCRPAGEA